MWRLTELTMSFGCEYQLSGFNGSNLCWLAYFSKYFLLLSVAAEFEIRKNKIQIKTKTKNKQKKKAIKHTGLKFGCIKVNFGKQVKQRCRYALLVMGDNSLSILYTCLNKRKEKRMRRKKDKGPFGALSCFLIGDTNLRGSAGRIHSVLHTPQRILFCF